MAVAYNYSSTAGEYTLTASVTSSVTSIQVNSVTGLPAVPFKLVIDPGLSTEEIVKVTAIAGTTLTVTRGWDSSLASAHSGLAKARHMMTAEDLRLARQHEDSTAVHGVGTVVGTAETQTLTNKNLASGTNTFPTSFATLTGAQVLSNKDLTAATNTFPAKFLTDAGTQVVTNKDLTSGTNTFPPFAMNADLAGHGLATQGVHGIGSTSSVVGTTDTQTLTNKNLTSSTNTFPSTLARVTQTLTHAAGAQKRVAWGRNLMNFSAGGCTFTHGLGWTPSVVIAGGEYSTTMFVVGARNFSSTTIEFRLVTGSGVYTGSENVNWIAIE